MNPDAPSAAVVIAPATAEEASSLFAALLSGGFHPTIDYGPEADGPKLANYPILVPQPELKEAQAYLRGLRVHASSPASPAQTSRIMTPRAPTPPARAEPAPTPLKQFGKAVGALGMLVAVTLGIVVVVLVLQFVSRLIAHPPT